MIRQALPYAIGSALFIAIGIASLVYSESRNLKEVQIATWIDKNGKKQTEEVVCGTHCGPLNPNQILFKGIGLTMFGGGLLLLFPAFRKPKK